VDDLIRRELRESAEVELNLSNTRAGVIGQAARLLIEALRGGGKVLLFGNGGSAADAQHLAAELVGRFQRERGPLPAIALTTDTSVLTAVANDYGFEKVFSRQIEAMLEPGDVVVAVSTSGRSPNVIEAALAARERGGKVIALCGRGGGTLAEVADVAIVVPSESTPRIQEAHIAIGHILCLLVERELDGPPEAQSRDSR